jgi:hypothetical protein
MHRPLGFLQPNPRAADQDILEQLVEGRLDSASIPPGCRGLAQLLAAAAAPAAPKELARERRALASFVAVLQSRPPTLSPRRTPVPTKVLTIKAAAAALVAVLSIGGIAAAATGLLPDQASPVADQATATTAADAAGHGLGKAAAANLAGTAPAGSTEGQGREAAVGPDATGAARAGLCRAWQAGQGTDHGRRMDAVAFQALVDAAGGGADNVAAYCEDVTVGASADARGQGQASPPSVSAPPTSASPPSSGPPADPGPPDSTGPGGHGQGGPPTTTG